MHFEADGSGSGCCHLDDVFRASTPRTVRAKPAGATTARAPFNSQTRLRNRPCNARAGRNSPRPREFGSAGRGRLCSKSARKGEGNTGNRREGQEKAGDRPRILDESHSVEVFGTREGASEARQNLLKAPTPGANIPTMRRAGTSVHTAAEDGCVFLVAPRTLFNTHPRPADSHVLSARVAIGELWARRTPVPLDRRRRIWYE